MGILKLFFQKNLFFHRYLSFISSLLISVFLILISLLQIQVPRGLLAGRSRVFLGRLSFLHGIMHVLKKFAPRQVKKGSCPGGSPISLGNNEHSRKALWPRENHTFEGGSTVFIFFHFPSFFHLFSFFSFLLVLLFLGCSKSFFFASIASRFPIKAIM